MNPIAFVAGAGLLKSTETRTGEGAFTTEGTTKKIKTTASGSMAAAVSSRG